MANFNPITNFRTTLAQSMTASQSTMVLSSVTMQGHALTASDYGVYVYLTINPGGANMEVVRASTNSSTTFTLDKRGLLWYGQGDDEDTAQKFNHSAGEPVIISNVKNFQEQYVDTVTDQTVTGTKTFPNSDATRIRLAADTDTAVAEALVTFGQLSRQAIAGAANASTTVKGLVQLPTQAQTDARTTTGSTGALLSVTPDVLRATKFIDFTSSSAGTDSYAITPVPAVTALTDGQVYVFEADVANTGAASLNVGGLGGLAIKKYGSKDLDTGDIAAGSIVTVAYDLDSTTFMLQTAVAKQQVSQSGAEINGGASVVGTDAYAITLVPAITAYAAGQWFEFQADVANTGAATLNVNALGAQAIRKNGTTVLTDGDIPAGGRVSVIYDGTNFQLMNPRNLALTNSLVPGFNVSIPVATASAWTPKLSGFSDATTKFIANFLYSSGADDCLSSKHEVSNDVGSSIFLITTAYDSTAGNTMASALYIGTDEWRFNANGTAGARIEKNGSAVTISGGDPTSTTAPLGHDPANSLLLELDTTTSIRRYSGISGTTITFVSAITLDTAVSNCGFLYDNTNSRYICVDLSNNLLRRFNSSGTTIDTVAYTVNDAAVTGICFIADRVYLISSIAQPSFTASVQSWLIDLIPTNMTR